MEMLFSPLPSMAPRNIDDTSWMSLSESQKSRNIASGFISRKTYGTHQESPLSSFRDLSRPPSHLRLQSIEELASVESTSPLRRSKSSHDDVSREFKKLETFPAISVQQELQVLDEEDLSLKPSTT